MLGFKKKQFSTHSPKYSSDETEIDKTNLYVKGLWVDCIQVELDDLFRPYGIITKSRVHGDGVGFVRFEKANDATKAILGLHGKKPNDKCTQELRISYAKKTKPTPKGIIRNANNEQIEMLVHQNSKNVYIRGLPLKYSTELLEKLCSPYGTITCIKSCKNGFAFVRYGAEDDADRAIQNLHGKYLDESDQPLLVKLANSDPFEPRIEFRNNSSTKNCIDESGGSSKNQNLISSLGSNNNSSSNKNNSNESDNSNNNYNNSHNDFNQSLSCNTIGNVYNNSNNTIETQIPNNSIYNIPSNTNGTGLVNNNVNDNNLYAANLYTSNYNDCNINFLTNCLTNCNLIKPFYPTTQATPSLNNNTNSNTSFLLTNDSSSTSPPLETMSTLSNSNAYSNTTQNTSQSPNLQVLDQYLQPSSYNLSSSSLRQNSPPLECTTSTLLSNNNNNNSNTTTTNNNNVTCNNLVSNSLCMPNTSINSTASLDENSLNNRNYGLSIINNNYSYITPAALPPNNSLCNNSNNIANIVANTFPSLEISNSMPRPINTLLSPSSVLSPSSNMLYSSTNNSPNSLIVNQSIPWVVSPTNAHTSYVYPNSGNFAIFSYQNL